MQFERFYSLNHDIVACFAHLHDLGFKPTLKNLGNVCGGNDVSIQPNANSLQVGGAQTPNICMTWMWDLEKKRLNCRLVSGVRCSSVCKEFLR
jgi:hypothetical protein